VRASSIAPLRIPNGSSELPWVRFLDEAASLGGPPPYRLRIGDGGGRFAGETLVGDKLGRHRDPLSVAIEKRAVLDVLVRDELSLPLEGDVSLLRAGRVIERSGKPTTDARFPWLENGDFELRVTRFGRAPCRARSRSSRRRTCASASCWRSSKAADGSRAGSRTRSDRRG
jgi:hypothetical protein